MEVAGLLQYQKTPLFEMKNNICRISFDQLWFVEWCFDLWGGGATPKLSPFLLFTKLTCSRIGVEFLFQPGTRVLRLSLFPKWCWDIQYKIILQPNVSKLLQVWNFSVWITRIKVLLFMLTEDSFADIISQ